MALHDSPKCLCMRFVTIKCKMDMVELNAICQLNTAEPCSHYKMQISFGAPMDQKDPKGSKGYQVGFASKCKLQVVAPPEKSYRIYIYIYSFSAWLHFVVVPTNLVLHFIPSCFWVHIVFCSVGMLVRRDYYYKIIQNTNPNPKPIFQQELL